MKKKAISLFLALTLMIMVIPTVSANETSTIFYVNGNWEFVPSEISLESSSQEDEFTQKLTALIQQVNIPDEASRDLPTNLEIEKIEIQENVIDVYLNDALNKFDTTALEYLCGILTYNLVQEESFATINYYNDSNMLLNNYSPKKQSSKISNETSGFDKLSNYEKNQLIEISQKTKIGDDFYEGLSDEDKAIVDKITQSSVKNIQARYVPNISVIVLDPGHGGTDGGAARTFNGVTYKESDLALNLALSLKTQLQSYGYTVYLTRSSDVSVNNVNRATMANNWGADAFVCLHLNATTANITTASGMMINYPSSHDTAWSADMSKWVDYNVTQNYGYLPRHQAPSVSSSWIVLNNTNMPAIFVETAFLNNISDVTKIYYSSSRNQIASAMAGGIKTWDDWGAY